MKRSIELVLCTFTPTSDEHKRLVELHKELTSAQSRDAPAVCRFMVDGHLVLVRGTSASASMRQLRILGHLIDTDTLEPAGAFLITANPEPGHDVHLLTALDIDAESAYSPALLAAALSSLTDE